MCLSFIQLFAYHYFIPKATSSREQGWHSGESTHLPPMWPGFNSAWTRRQMWVEFVVGSHSCSGGFSLGSPVSFPAPQKPILLNSNSIWNQWDRKSHYVEDATVNSHLFPFIIHSN